jgi:dsDNA-specific endonuclease/ATPase MutS2
MEFTAISGVGEKTAASLAELDDAEAALRRGDVATIARAPEITEGRAAAIARAAIRREHGDDGGFLATDRAREIYGDVLSLLQERAVTNYGAKRLETLFPSTEQSRIEEVRGFADAAIEREPDADLLSALADVEPLEPVEGIRVRERCIATTDAERYAEAKAALPELPVEVIEERRELGELGRSYSTVYVLDAEFAGIDVEGDVRVLPDALEAPEELVPERTLAFFATNRERLLAAAEVHEVAGTDSPCDLEALRASLARVDDEGGVVGDEELERLSVAVDDIDAAVATAESVANDHLREAIGEKDVTIEGADFLSLVEQGARVDSLLDRELADDYDEAVERARGHVIESLSLNQGEAEFVERVFGGEPSFPLEHNEAAVSRLRTELTAERDRRANTLESELAETLRELREPAEELVHDALELDVELAVSQFTRDFDCTMPTFAGSGFAIEGGRSPLLDVPFAAVDPVDYEVDGVTVLSGVNSGGKTSTLDLVGLVVILAHMGLPVPADAARVGPVSELHYYAKSQGTLDAGAFESTLRDFGELIEGASGRLVLVDELESITEPGASAKIIAGILEELHAQDASAVFVSHLADGIREAAGFEVAVDGIEAVGLIDGELRVDRSPKKNHLARSTPELIVEKLAGDAETGFYRSLLEKF